MIDTRRTSHIRGGHSHKRELEHSHGDFDLKISECDADYEIGKWIGLALRDGEVLDHGIAFLPDLPPVRVRNGTVEVLTVGTIISWSNRKISLCDTPDFGAIPILDQLPNNAERSYQNLKFQIWARRLNEEECECFGGHKWGVSQFVNDAPPHNDNVEVASEPQVYCDDRDIDGLNVPLSVTLAHRQGDDFYHEELGAIRDERRLLQSGQDYEATVVRIRPRPSTVENEMAMWKVLSAVPIGESWAPHFSRKVSKVKRHLPGKARSQPLQRSANAMTFVGQSTSVHERKDDADNPVLDCECCYIEPKHLDNNERHSVTALYVTALHTNRKRGGHYEVYHNCLGYVTAMVEMQIEKGRYRVWLLDYHQDADFCTSRTLEPGHFFQGRFRIGGGHKVQWHIFTYFYDAKAEAELLLG
ncbi:hypothetical protein NECAME_11239 [Necator americanus]|uniref:Uncharacterized protein n=1 Tax=Necator americanus TaxID=51031 RepID=W2T7I2_NECAM|nr:hypothetical protein NECAME_11239 [Necator americanus]ETN77126.1 hypothetical protein NECAME_11239 [Necator americanus]